MKETTEMLSINRLHEVVTDILMLARKEGADAAEAGAHSETGLGVNVRMSEIETVEFHQGQGVGITVYFGHRKGSASTNDLSHNALASSVAAACRIARYAQEDTCAGLPEERLLARHCEDLDLYHPWDITVDQAVALALSAESAALDFHDDIANSDGASVNSYSGARVLGNSLGFQHGYLSSRHSISCSVIAQQGQDMQRDDWWTVARRADELASAESIGLEAAKRSLARLGSRSLPTSQCPVIFDATIAGSLIGHLISAISGGNLYRKSSFLLDMLGKDIFPDFVHLHESPLLKGALGSAPHDSEGVAVSAKDIIRDGRLASYLLGSYSARRLGMQSTGNAGGTHNLRLDSGHLDLSELLREMQRGLLVTELLGQGVNTVTGDYSRGAAGFWVDHGEIQFPVEEITIAGNLKDMYRGLMAIGNDVERRGNLHTGSIWLREMTVAGNQ